ncbi:MAG: hypothetical protein AUG51_22170 [Acidobacteria bacterium 13_1_20CM_3_53_8]|nr:MAG: hypothetical protein AUG51_22170 [Acidobacteria bacterium 13_1_20CM_3_53_8]
MRLTYATYGIGHALLTIYCNEKELTSFTIRFVNPETHRKDAASFTSYAPMIHVGPAMLCNDFALEAWQGGEKIGECRGAFLDGVKLAEQTGYFEKVSQAAPLIDREMVSASRTNDGPGLQPTEIVLLSRKWEKIHQLLVHSVVDGQRLEWWDNNGLVEEEGGGDRRISGWSESKKTPITELHCACVAILSGLQQGKTGYLLWGGDGGIKVSAEKTMGAAIAPSTHHIPKWLHTTIEKPPASVTRKD